MVDHSPALDRVFGALANPTRRAIVDRLARRSATVTELAEPFAMSLNAVSKHLMVLERAGLVRRQVTGREHHCSLAPAAMSEAAAWMEHYRTFWETRLDQLDDFLTAAHRRKSDKPRGGTQGKRR